MYNKVIIKLIVKAIFFFGLFLKNLGLDLKFLIFNLHTITRGLWRGNQWYGVAW
jgi:hypothetical protein